MAGKVGGGVVLRGSRGDGSGWTIEAGGRGNE